MSTVAVAILQNQWLKDPEKWRATMEGPDRERFIKKLLFFRCVTGQRILQTFGQELVDQILWEEASREIGAHSGAAFPCDRAHVVRVIEKHKPAAVVLFGKIAHQAQLVIAGMPAAPKIILAPHPAARHNTVINELYRAKNDLEQCLKS